MDRSTKSPFSKALLAATFFVVTAAAALPSQAIAEVCRPDNPIACLLRCRLHKYECFSGCRADKLACFAEVRGEAQACRLSCRLDGGTDEEISSCRRRCTARAYIKAYEVCRLGRPTCVRLCHPGGCLEECGLVDDTDAAPAAGETLPQGGDPTRGDPEPPMCVPPIDRECLGACGRDLRACATAVQEETIACVDSCSELHGRDRLRCVGDCVKHAHESAAVCELAFRECVGECGVDVDQVDPPAVE